MNSITIFVFQTVIFLYIRQLLLVKRPFYGNLIDITFCRHRYCNILKMMTF